MTEAPPRFSPSEMQTDEKYTIMWACNVHSCVSVQKEMKPNAKVPHCTTVSNAWITSCVSLDVANVRLTSCSVCRTSGTLQSRVTAAWLMHLFSFTSVHYEVLTGTFSNHIGPVSWKKTKKKYLPLQSISFLLFGTKAGRNTPSRPSTHTHTHPPR